MSFKRGTDLKTFGETGGDERKIPWRRRAATTEIGLERLSKKGQRYDAPIKALSQRVILTFLQRFCVIANLSSK
jgi:hypothetical protein